MCGGASASAVWMSSSSCGQRLAGQRVHQVEVEGVKRLRGFFDGGQGLRAVVHAAQRQQVRVVEALHADRQPRDARATEGLEAVLLEGAGVGLERDFAVGRQRQPGADVAQQAGRWPAARTGWACRRR